MSSFSNILQLPKITEQVLLKSEQSPWLSAEILLPVTPRIFFRDIRIHPQILSGGLMKPTRMLLTAASSLLVSQVMAGEAVFYITEDGNAMRDVAVSVDGQKQLVGSSGFVNFNIDGGNHKVELTHMGEWVGDFEFVTENTNQNAEVQVDVIGGEALEEVSVYTPGQEETPAIGQISGHLQSDETGGPVVGARISIAGTETGVMTDDDGFFSFELPRGQYSLAVSHPNYGKRDVNNLRVMSGVNTGVNLTMSMSGNGMIEEVVAVGSYIPTTATAQERDSSAVLDAIGSEQMARFGDSSAASALKRVAGVSVVGGQFAVVRGLQGRYIASTLNGGSMPSTDPMRRDVPLDLFPASVLGGINIQKTYTPDMPGDATGGVIQMTTKGLPDESVSKLSVDLGMNNRTTFSDINSYEGGKTDYLGVDDGTRDLPSAIDSNFNGDNGLTYCPSGSGDALCTYPAEMAAMGTSLDHNYNVNQTQAKPARGFSYAFGDRIESSGEGEYGYYGAIQYKDSTEARHDATLDDNNQSGSYERSKRKIDTTAYFVGGYETANTTLLSKTTILRKTDDTTKTTSIYDSSADQQINKVILQWTERQFLGQQFSGEHLFDDDNQQVNWHIGIAQTKRDEPDRRSYTYINNIFIPSTLERRYSELTEDAVDAGVDYTFNTLLSDDIGLKIKTGLMTSQKDRTVDMTRVGVAASSSSVDTTGDIESVVNDASFESGDLILSNRTTGTDSYKATDNISALYVSGEVDFGDVQVLTGARMEDSEQTLEYPYSSSNKNSLSSSDVLPVLSANWQYNEELQLRAAVSKTLSRPGLTELSESVQFDPETDEEVYGNPELVISTIDNLDLRAEYYFSDEENISAAIFTKSITDPIERTIVDASGSAASGTTFRNEDSADLTGIEFDFRLNTLDTDEWTGFVAGNYSYIDAIVNLSADSARLEGKDSRQLQGQSKNLANLQIGFDHLPTGQSVTLLVNHFSDRIHLTSRADDPIIEDGRITLDLAYEYEVDENLSVKAKAGNITDSKVSYSRGGSVTESYYEGMDISAGVSYQF
jgi:hypothetical protein